MNLNEERLSNLDTVYRNYKCKKRQTLSDGSNEREIRPIIEVSSSRKTSYIGRVSLISDNR